MIPVVHPQRVVEPPGATRASQAAAAIDSSEWDCATFCMSMIPQRKADLVAREVEGEALILDRSAGKVHQLNVTAAYIWGRCDGRSSILEVASGLASEFVVDTEVARRDVAKTVGEFEKLGLLMTQDADHASEQTRE